jgi:tetratricopeptide (TPR) repeat protein
MHLGKLAESEDLIVAALDACPGAEGGLHGGEWLRAGCLESYATVRTAQGFPALAVPLYRKVVEIHEAAGPMRLGTARALNRLAGVLETTDRHAEASASFKKALEICGKTAKLSNSWGNS